MYPLSQRDSKVDSTITIKESASKLKKKRNLCAILRTGLCCRTAPNSVFPVLKPNTINTQQNTTRYKSDSTDFISVTCLQQNRLKVHKTEMTCHTSLALTSGLIFLSGSNPIKCSYQAQDLSSRDV